jgi:hypothetical protein
MSNECVFKPNQAADFKNGTAVIASGPNTNFTNDNAVVSPTSASGEMNLGERFNHADYFVSVL